MNPKLVVSALILALAAAPSTQAQVIDLSKITCKDWIFYKISNPNAIAEFLSGYYHGKRNDPVIDLQMLQANADKVRSYCEKQTNWNATLMQAGEQILDTGK